MGDGRRGEECDARDKAGWTRDERGEVEKKNNASFHSPPRSSILSLHLAYVCYVDDDMRLGYTPDV